MKPIIPYFIFVDNNLNNSIAPLTDAIDTVRALRGIPDPRLRQRTLDFVANEYGVSGDRLHHLDAISSEWAVGGAV